MLSGREPGISPHMIILRALPALLTLIGVAALVALGAWQQERLAWKQDLLARIAERQTLPVIEIRGARDVAALSRDTHNYRRARLVGKNWQQAVYWFAQIHNRPKNLPRADAVGYHMLVPFELADDTLILLDVGFVPKWMFDAYIYDIPIFTDLQTVLRWPDKRTIFDARDDAFNNLFYVRDPAAIGRHWEIDLPDFIAERTDAGEAWPRGGQTRLTLTNRHFGYMLTWYGLAVVLVFMSGLWHIRVWRRRGQ